MMDLDGQVAIVTGAASDIGAAIAVALAGQGADLALIGRRAEALRPVAAEVQAQGRRAEVLTCDLTEGAQVTRMVAEVHVLFSNRIDTLVNAAGGTGGLGVPVWELTESEFNRVLAVNLTASFLTMAAVLPAMIARRSGRIINIGGTYGMRGRAGRAAYSAAKWGLRGLTKSAALEAGPFNITVNCVSPGMVEGPRFDEAATDAAVRGNVSMGEAKTRMEEAYALRRISTPKDVAQAVVFLAGLGGRQMTGQDLVVDGGWVI
ncbi:MAG TPA: SDR family NAD(P)-dependent oxidoreductase [Acetobacteraceae bacterium]|jgi:NAD(P)-dependent dehydrogenase (short-subunit alcohol dehydrogenase family)|nr:SDR family NAD(P)-dependent oxidoreductase [Acetobacteraceae bacterium]